MKQIASNPHTSRKTRKQIFLHHMDQVLPWSDLVDRITPYYPECKTERGPIQLQTLLRTHFMQQWFELSDPAMEEAFYDTPVFRDFALTDKSIRLPDENTIMRFRYRLEKYKLDKQIQNKVFETLAQEGLMLTPGSVVDAQLTPTDDSLSATPSTPKSSVTTQLSDQNESTSQVETQKIHWNQAITVSEQESTIYLDCQPVAGQADLDIHTLQTIIADQGFSECAIETTALQAVIDKCIGGTNRFRTVIGKRVDAKLVVHIAEDEMSASIQLLPAQGGSAISLNDMLCTLQVEGVVAGLDEQAIASAANSGCAENLVVAKGLQPLDGENTVFKTLISNEYSEANATDIDGRIDYRAQNSISMVALGDPLVRRIPATNGQAGYTVRGRVLEAKPGVDTDFAPDLPGTQKLDSDPNILFAAIPGHPVAVDNGMRVEPVIRLSEVNLTTGNIDFDGAVHIDGDVIQGMRVKATGDILIGGVVERSFIETPGDILVKGGVIGDAQLNAGGVIRARFAQSATLHAVNSIEIDEMALQCYLTAQKNICVGLKIPQRGRLVGGIARALESIKVPFLGSNEGTLTRVIVGLQEELENQFRTMQFSIFDKQTSIDSLTKIVNKLIATGDPKKLLDRAQASLLETRNTLADMERQSQAMDDQLNLMRKSKIEVTKETLGLVEVTVANYKVHLTKGYGRGHFGLSDENRVVHIDPKGFSGLAN